MTGRSKRNDWKNCAIVGVALLSMLSLGCPGITDLIIGTTALTINASASSGATVDKPVTLTATVSGGTAPYTVEWSRTAGPSGTIADAAAAETTFTPSAVGTYTFQVAVSDSSGLTQSATRSVTFVAADIQFNAVTPSSESSLFVDGNPATAGVSSQATTLGIATYVTVSDPDFPDDLTTEMTVRYEIVSVPDAAREADTSFATAVDTFTNAPLANDIAIRPNPDSSFKTLTNIATTFDNFGIIVPGDYVFRASVTNPDNVTRSRDLTVTVLVEGVDGLIGEGAGPRTLVVKELPEGSPGKVTDKVMQGSDSATMVVTAFPTSTTSYRFYLEDNNGIPHMDYVAASASELSGTGEPQDITLTIGSESGIPTGTYTLLYESFDSLGQMAAAGAVSVNDPGGTDVRFHVTDDFLDGTSINAVFVGMASNNADGPTPYEGWSGGPASSYGSHSVLADVNLDGGMDIITLTGSSVRINTRGYIDGSEALLRHPDNSGNFGPELPSPLVSFSTFGGDSIAVGDLNGDELPDIAVGGDGMVQVFFHTGDPLQLYSDHEDQTLFIYPPVWESLTQASTGDLDAGPGAPDDSKFGMQVGIAPVFGEDEQADLIITDPGFSMQGVYEVADPNDGDPNTWGPDFFDQMQGRVYVFAGGSDSNLLPSRPDIVTSEITETQVFAAVDDDNDPNTPDVDLPDSVEFDEPNDVAAFSAAYMGDLFDRIGYSLATGGSFAVGSPWAIEAYSNPMSGITFDFQAGGDRIADGEIIATMFGGWMRTYEFDTDGLVAGFIGATPGTDQDPDDPDFVGTTVVVDISGEDEDLPSAALAALLTAISEDEDHVCEAGADAADPEHIFLVSTFGALDELNRDNSGAGYVMFNPGADPNDMSTWFSAGGAAFSGASFDGVTYNNDGVVYTVANDTASGALTDALRGISNSDMGLGLDLAMADFNGAGDMDDLLVSSWDDGTDAGTHNGTDAAAPSEWDGGVFMVLDGATTLPDPVDAGADTRLDPTGILPTELGATVGAGDVDGDGLYEAFFTEPGFDRIYMIMGASEPSAAPDMTFVGVTFDDDTTSGGAGTPSGSPDGGSLGTAGSFLFGDVNGDTEADWLFLDTSVNFGFAGFAR